MNKPPELTNPVKNQCLIISFRYSKERPRTLFMYMQHLHEFDKIDLHYAGCVGSHVMK